MEPLVTVPQGAAERGGQLAGAMRAQGLGIFMGAFPNTCPMDSVTHVAWDRCSVCRPRRKPLPPATCSPTPPRSSLLALACAASLDIQLRVRATHTEDHNALSDEPNPCSCIRVRKRNSPVPSLGGDVTHRRSRAATPPAQPRIPNEGSRALCSPLACVVASLTP